MTSFLSNTIRNVLRATTKQLAGVDIVYKSFHTGLSYAIRATPDASRAESETLEGLVMSARIRDYKIDIADLPVIPQHKDTIVETDDNGVEQHYMVLQEAGVRETEPGDNFSVYWRVHTKMIPAPAVTQTIYGNAAGTAFGNDAGTTYGGASS